MNDQNTLYSDDYECRLLQPGQRFGVYRVVRLLGKGGMGEVYEVLHMDLGKSFALKLILPNLLSNPGQIDRFREEARVMSGLQHENVLSVDDFGETEGKFWLRMPLVEGGSLKDKLDQANARLPIPDVFALLEATLHGLEYVHSRSVIHRDLKPGNLLIDGSGKLLITDFGLVDVVRETSEVGSAPPVDLDVTYLEGGDPSSDRKVEGSFTYMSPEQKKGEVLDARSDLYAVGMIAYELLTGETVLSQQAPSELAPGLSKAWDAWIKRATSIRPQNRFQTAAEMLAALPVKSKPVKQSASTKPKGGKFPVLPVLIGTVALVIAGLGAFFFVGVSRESGSTATTTPGPSVPGEPLPAEREPEPEPVVPPSTGESFTIDDLGMSFIWLEKGRFEMGSELGDKDELKPHKVRVDGFWMAATEVTRAQWKALMTSIPSKYDSVPENAAIDSVNWAAAMEYCRLLTEQERELGRLPKGYRYSLPTEAQWEYAARAGRSDGSVIDFTQVAWFQPNSERRPHSVAAKAANPWGFYDMFGNAWEWTRSAYSKYPKHEIANSAEDSPVVRGGGWMSDYTQLRPSIRGMQIPGVAEFSPGFRVALTEDD